MVKAYQTIGWKNYPSTDTPLNETNLLKIDNGLNTVDNRVISLDTTKLDLATANTMVKNITYNEANGVFTVTYLNGTTATLDTKLEKLAVNFEYDPTTEQLIVTLSDGTKQYVDLKSLITEYNFENSSEIAFTVTEGKVSAGIVNGSVTESKLQPNFLADCRSAKTDAETASTSASSKALVSEGYALGTQNGVAVTEGEYYHNNSKYFKEQAAEIVGGNYVPTSRKINGKELTSDITLSANDIGFSSENLESTNVKDALEELKENIDGITFITWGDDALEDDVSELESGTMYCQMEDGNIKKAWIGIDDVAKPFSAGSPSPTPTSEITFVVEGAKEDNITIKDADGTVVGNVIFDTDATYKEVTLTIAEEGGDYTFESSVAKATDGSNANYSKVVHLPLSASALGDCALVPIMTSNTTPSGEAFSSGALNSTYSEYKAFDKDLSTVFAMTPATSGWLAYDFVRNVSVNYATLTSNYADDVIATRQIQYSDDKISWTNASSVQTQDLTQQDTSLSFSCTGGSHRYWRVYTTTNVNSGANIKELQFYTKAVKVMPNNSLYWYGNELTSWSKYSGQYYLSWATFSNVTSGTSINTNSMVTNPNGSTSDLVFGSVVSASKVDLSEFSKLKCYGTYTSKAGTNADTAYVAISDYTTLGMSGTSYPCNTFAKYDASGTSEQPFSIECNINSNANSYIYLYATRGMNAKWCAVLAE